MHGGRLNLPVPGIAEVDVGQRRLPGPAHPQRPGSRLAPFIALDLDAALQMGGTQFAFGREYQLRGWRSCVHPPALAR